MSATRQTFEYIDTLRMKLSKARNLRRSPGLTQPRRVRLEKAEASLVEAMEDVVVGFGSEVDEIEAACEDGGLPPVEKKGGAS